MWASDSVRLFATIMLLGSGLITGGCRRPPDEEDPRTRQAQARADREAALAYLKEDGEVDWRKRVDAASQALEEAKSDRRWGRSEKALEHALQAARLLPPASKDFDAASTETHRGDGESESTSDSLPEEGGFPAGDEPLGGGGDSVSNDEVQKLKESLESLLESLEGKTGRGSSDLSFERDMIEIR